MATHSSILAWRIPWTEEPGGLKTMGSHRVTQLNWLSKHAHTVYPPHPPWTESFSSLKEFGGLVVFLMVVVMVVREFKLWKGDWIYTFELLRNPKKSHSEIKKYHYSTHSCHLVEKQIITQYRLRNSSNTFLLRVVTCQGDVVQTVWGSFFFDLKNVCFQDWFTFQKFFLSLELRLLVGSWLIKSKWLAVLRIHVFLAAVWKGSSLFSSALIVLWKI